MLAVNSNHIYNLNSQDIIFSFLIFALKIEPNEFPS